jgi:hypothetical protein
MHASGGRFISRVGDQHRKDSPTAIDSRSVAEQETCGSKGRMRMASRRSTAHVAVASPYFATKLASPNVVWA